MSTITHRAPGNIEAALRSDEPHIAVRDECVRLMSEEGYSREALLGALGEFRERLRLEGRDQDDDVVLDVMDLLSGWAGPHAVLK